jgi:hypothetical protein
MAAERTTGVAARVALAMAYGDRPVGIGCVREATNAELAAECEINEVYVRSVKARIRRQLGPQATARDLGWRPK